MLNTPFPFKRLSGAVSERDSLRVVVFAIADYLFALPVGAVLKVMACPPISSTVESGIGMVDLGRKPSQLWTCARSSFSKYKTNRRIKFPLRLTLQGASYF